jgi:putative MATE family efflux protein
MLVREKQFYITFFKLSAMMASQNLLSFGVNLADNIMLGRYSETTLAAAAMVNQVQYLLQMISVAGIGAGALAMVAQYWGKGEADPIRRIIALSMKFALAAGLLFFSISFFMPKTVVSLFTNDAVVREEGLTYLRLMCFTYITYPIQSALVMSLRGVRTVSIGPIVSVVSLVTNIVFNYMFIFGNWGAPEMGIYGAALATLIARVLELAIVLIYVRVFDKKLHLRLLSFFKPDAFYLRDFSKAAIPVILSGASWGIGMMMQVVILGHVARGVVAANSISSTVYQLITVYAFGSTSTSSVMMGNAVGAGQLDRVKPYARTFQLLFIINGLLTGVVIFLTRDLILSLYILEPGTQELARTFLTFLSLVVVFASYEYPVESGIILGGGNTRYAFIVDTFFIWLVVLPFSALSAFVWKFAPLITFIFLKSDQFLKCIPNGITVNRYRWVRILTKET